MIRITTALSAVVLAASTALALPVAASDTGGRSTNVNGDAFADLVIGAPGERVGGNEHAGAVFVTTGRAGGLSVASTRMLTQDTAGLLGVAEAWDEFGAEVATGDFDGDLYSDIAIGIPGETVGGSRRAGAVQVIYGGASGPTRRDHVFTQSNIGIDASEERDRFGSALAVGRFDSDGFDDLAIGAPGETVGSRSGAGAVDILYGSASGLSGTYAQHFTLSTAGVPGSPAAGDRLGTALAAASFDGTGSQDLAVGAPGRAIGGARDAGEVIVLKAESWGLAGSGSQHWSLDTVGINGRAQAGDAFGSALAANAWGADGRGDLAVGVPGADVGGHRNAGAINVIQGAAGGLSSDFDFRLHEDSTDIPGSASGGERFGSVLGVGDVAGDVREDLLVGVPDEKVGGRAAAGAVYAIPTFSDAPGGYGTMLLRRGRGLPGVPREGDRFGASVAAGGFDADTFDDLVVGVPGDGIAGEAAVGAVEVVWSGYLGIGRHGRLLLSEATTGVASDPQRGDRFGSDCAA